MIVITLLSSTSHTTRAHIKRTWDLGSNCKPKIRSIQSDGWQERLWLSCHIASLVCSVDRGLMVWTPWSSIMCGWGAGKQKGGCVEIVLKWETCGLREAYHLQALALTSKREWFRFRTYFGHSAILKASSQMHSPHMMR